MQVCAKFKKSLEERGQGERRRAKMGGDGGGIKRADNI